MAAFHQSHRPSPRLLMRPPEPEAAYRGVAVSNWDEHENPSSKVVLLGEIQGSGISI